MALRTKLLTCLVALMLIASACGSSDSSVVAAADSETEASDTEAEATEAETADGDADADEAGDEPVDANLLNGGKPEVEIAGGDSPTELVIDDLIEGTGDVAAVGDVLEMHYVGVLFDDGSQFDASWDRDQTFSFVLGSGNVIQGWDQGIVGMSVGGRRQLTIPAEFAYGDNSPSPAIPPGSTLVFVVDLVGITR